MINLKLKIFLLNGIIVIVGSIVGLGIFVSFWGVLVGCGSVGLFLIVWILCGFYFMIGVYCYVELGIMIIKFGVDYVYLYEVFGLFVVFL